MTLGRGALLLLALLPGRLLAACHTPEEPALAIIIDDLGYSLSNGLAMAEIPAPLTLSVIPATPHAQRLAEEGLRRGKEIMVHLPMASQSQPSTDPLALSGGLSERTFEQIADRALTAVPGATGANNHMGSAMTTDRVLMAQLMARVQAHNMFFIDSRTTPDTVAAQVAEEMSVPHASRSVFLDNERSVEAIEARLVDVITLALEQGSAIAIGHPYPETIAVLRDALPRLPHNLTITAASTMTRCKTNQRLISIP